jgi:hypothetical protein
MLGKTSSRCSLRRISRTENRVEDEANYDGAKEDDAEKDPDAFAPVKDDPSAADRNRQPRQANAQGEEEVNRLLSADDAHRKIVAGWGEGVRS